MVEAQVDPMEPPKHLIKKMPRGPGSPPVPVLHSPPRKLTVEDKQAWKVPPCISNWKNARGYTIPLDKRLAADGRGLQEVTINNKFANLSESLYVAERKASEDLRIRNQIRKKMAMREKEDREKDLRDMASKARMERAGVMHNDDDEDDFGVPETEERNPSIPASASVRQREEIDEPPRRSSGGDSYNDRDRERGSSRGDGNGESSSRNSYEDRDNRYESRGDRDEEESAPQGESSEERVARQQRERLRQDRRKEREREIRLENMKVSALKYPTMFYETVVTLIISHIIVHISGQYEEK